LNLFVRKTDYLQRLNWPANRIVFMKQNQDYDEQVRFLPFYVNGTLDAAGCAQIDAALAQTLDLRDELALLSGLAHIVKTGGRDMTQGSDQSETRLAAVLGQLEDKAPAQQPLPAPAPQPRSLGSLLSFLNPKRWHPAVSLTLAAAAILQGVTISNLNQGTAEKTAQIASLQKRVGALEFELASGPDGNAQGSVLIQVKAEAPWSQVEALLGKEGLSIVSGPSDGALTLSSDAKGAALDALIVKLRASPLIASADKVA
jgi:hypothetical protein